MSLKSRLIALLVTALLVIALAISAVDLNGLVETFLESARDRTEFTAQQVKTLLLERLNTASESRLFATADEAKGFWLDSVRTDPQIAALLERTMASSRVVIEISIAGADDVRILASSSPLLVGKPLVHRPDFQVLQAMNPWRRFLETLEGRQDYEIVIPVGITSPPTPVFQIQVLASSVLQRNALLPHLRRVAYITGVAVVIAILLSILAAGIALRPLENIAERIDQITSGASNPTPRPKPPGTSTREFAIVETKLNILGEQFRGARQLIENLEEAIILTDQDQRILLAGEPAERMLGIARAGLVGKRLNEALPPTDTELGAALARAIPLQLPITDRIVNWHRPSSPSGKDPLRLLVNLELLPGGGALIRLRDSEGRRQVESQLDLSQRLAAISRITGGVAHEIKNPLNSIALRLEVLRAKLSSGASDAEAEIDVIAEEVTRLDRVVKTFLDFTRPVELTLSDIDLRELLAELSRLVEPQAAAAMVTINFQTEPNVVFEMRGDRDLLKQALLNVIVNAIEAMEKPDGGGGGILRIKLDSLISSRQGRQAVIAISDSGPGIPPEAKDRVFQLYYTTKPRGSGIGLALAFRIAQLHGGKIEFSSNPAQGTTFLFLFPLVQDQKGPE